MANLRDFKLDDNGDIVIENGQLAMVSGYDEVAQNVNTIIATEYGASSIVDEVGMSYENIWGKDFNEDFAQQDIEEAILDQEPRVTSVDDVAFSLDAKTRMLTITLSLIVDLTQSGNEETLDVEVGVDAA